MEAGDLELGNVNPDLELCQSLLRRVEKGDSLIDIFSATIFLAPDAIRDLCPTSFHPKMVAIGPIHRADENLQAFEGHKESYANKLLSRLPFQKDEILNSCMQKVRSSITKIKSCYVWMNFSDDDKATDMVIMDAFFIIEFCLRHWKPNGESPSGNMVLVRTIVRDLILLENQIPLFILDEIFQCTVLKINPSTSLVELLHPVLSCNNLFEADINIQNISINDIPHILGLLHHCYRPQVDNIISDSRNSISHSAIVLHNAGVSFVPNKSLQWVMGMNVNESLGKAVLETPVLRVDDHTGPVLCNLVVFEQSCASHRYITSYTHIMQMLVRSEEDVDKLVTSGVLVNYLGSNEEVVNIISNILRNITVVECFYEEQCKMLNKYYNSYGIAWLRRSCRVIPWRIISLAVVFFPIIIGVAQTIISYMSAVNNK